MTAELALTKPDPTLTHGALKTMMDAALRYVQSGLLPPEIKTPQQALLLMKAGRELGVPDTYALRNIHIVKGKPTCSAELMLALVRRTYGPAAIRVAKTTNTECTVQYREQGWDGISEYSFTIDDARQAGVTGTTTWKSYPAAMLRARCISAVARFAFPEAIAGLYTPEELGAQVTVSDDGSVESFITEPTRPDLKIIEGAVVEEDAPFGPEDVKPTASTSSARATAPSPAADAPVASVPRKSTPARPVQQQPEPAPSEEERARAMVGPDAGTVAALREQAIIRYHQLAAIAIERQHDKAERINAIDPATLSDRRLGASVKQLEEYFPDVPEVGAESLDEAF